MSWLLGCKEWLKGVGERFGAHACARVSHANGDVLAGGKFGIEPKVVLIRRDIRRFDRKFAALEHGVACVDREIDDRGFKVIGIDFNCP